MGFDPDLEGATKIASGEAYAVASMAVDLRVTELVDGNVGVHAMVAKSLLR
jgi:acetamidase/formamidase